MIDFPAVQFRTFDQLLMIIQYTYITYLLKHYIMLIVICKMSRNTSPFSQYVYYHYYYYHYFRNIFRVRLFFEDRFLSIYICTNVDIFRTHSTVSIAFVILYIFVWINIYVYVVRATSSVVYFQAPSSRRLLSCCNSISKIAFTS